MGGRERAAFAALKLDWVRTPEDVWKPSTVHVDGIHAEAAGAIVECISQIELGTDGNPPGLVVQGQAGTGKTHLLGWVREMAHAADGYFFLVGPLGGTAFWESVAGAMVEGITREIDGEGSQLRVFLRRLGAVTGASPEVIDSVTGRTPLEQAHLKDLVVALRTHDRRLGGECQDTLRALVYFGSDDLEDEDVGRGYLQSMDEQFPNERAIRGMRTQPKPAVEIVREISRLLALTGPTVIAVDQIDTATARMPARQAVDPYDRVYEAGAAGAAETGGAADTAGMEPDGAQVDPLINEIADGLLGLRDRTTRTLCLLGCLPATWTQIETQAVASVRDRFRLISPLRMIGAGDLAEQVVARRFGERYRAIGYEPPYPTWPVRREALLAAGDYTPRALLQRIDQHVQAGLAADTFADLERFDADIALVPPVVPDTEPGPQPPPPDQLDALDAAFERLRAAAIGREALSAANEDATVPDLLAAGLTAWISELGAAGNAFLQGSKPSAKPPLHAKLRRVVDEDSGDEEHWSFRAILSTNPRASITRLNNASTMSGIATGVGAGAGPATPRDTHGMAGPNSRRHLVLLRTAEWSKGATTQNAVEAFEKAGGVTYFLDDDEDIRTFAALREMFLERHPALEAWLLSRRPAGGTRLLGETLGDVVREVTAATTTASTTASTTMAPTDGTTSARTSPRATGPAGGPDAPDDGGSSAPAGPTRSDGPPGDRAASPAGATTDPAPGVLPHPTNHAGAATGATAGAHGRTLALGVAEPSRTPVRVRLESLRRHTAIFAGSGSGKTVLIRRLVEECALRGVSSIVLDPNNDLARLGDGWPRPPRGWGPGDAELAREYLARTEVVVWTPRRQAGRPLSFQPLPDFRGLRGDPDELEVAIDAAATTLAARADVAGTTRRASVGQAILRETLKHFARGNRTSLDSFLDLLGDLPDGVTTLDPTDKIAKELAQTLRAATVNDPLFGGRGTAVDPGELLTPAPGRRARVSVISLIGLPGDAQRQGFVSQLQMALFAWAKRNPAGDRPLGGLFVMDEAQTFAPSSGSTPCTASTLALASQARKYGLGLVFATQAPKGLHNQISGNATTQFFGRLNVPVQIEAAKEMAKVMGGEAPDIGRLGVGEFYAASEGVAFQRLRAPMCLSHHPASPLTAEEVIARAGTSAATSAAASP